MHCRQEEKAGQPMAPLGTEHPDALGGMPVSISSGVSIGKQRHKECLISHLSIPCGEGSGGKAVRMASVPTDSTWAHRDGKLLWERKCPPCQSILRSSSHGQRGRASAPRTWLLTEGSSRGLCSGTPEPPPATLSPYSPMALVLVSSPDRPLGCLGAVAWSPPPAWWSLALYFPF